MSARVAQLVPVVDPEGDVVEASVGTGEEGDVVRRVAALEEGRQLVAVVGEDLLGHPEVEHVAEEVGDGVDVLAHQEHMVDPRRRHADQPVGADRRVELRHPVADLRLTVLELDDVAATGHDEADDLAGARGQASPGA